MISNTSRYAIRALIYLAINNIDDKKIGIKRISEDLGIPSPFLGKIMQTLAKQKVLDSTKGPNGGFSISRKAQKISLIEIIKIIDGDDLFDKCLISNKSCKEKEDRQCALHKHYEKIREDIQNLFSGQTIELLAQDFKDAKGTVEI